MTFFFVKKISFFALVLIFFVFLQKNSLTNLHLFVEFSL